MEFQLEYATQILKRTPPTLNSLLRHLSDAWVLHNEGPESWSPYDVLGHLIHGEETDWIPRAKIILENGAILMQQMTNLSQLPLGRRFPFFAPCIKMTGAEGSPARFFALIED